MGGGQTGGRLRAALPAFAAALALSAPATALAGGGQLAASSPLTARGPLSPGDLVAAGFDVSYAAAHPATTVSASAVASLDLSCRTGDAPVVHLSFTLRSVSFAMPADDTSWHATASPSAAAGYLGTAQVPDACGGHRLWADAGVGFAVQLSSADGGDRVQLRFHAVDGEGTDCTAQPSGSSACSADWTSAVSALPAGPPSSPGSSPPSPAASPAATKGPAASGAPAAAGAARGAPDSAAAARTAGTLAAREAAGASPEATPGAGGGFTLPVVGPSERIVGRSQLVTTNAGGAGSILDDLPVGWIGLLVGMDLLLTAAVVVRRRRLARARN